MSRPSPRKRPRRPPRSPADSDPDRHWGKLEADRDHFRQQVGHWRAELLATLPGRAGLDPERGEVKLVMREFQQRHGDVDPDRALPKFREFAAEHGLLPRAEGG